jgi:hypothetical protein
VAGALHALRGLLPGIKQILGPDHPEALATRNDIAYWTGRYGDAAGALRLSRELLSAYERVLGPGDSDTPTIRDNIAHGAQMLAEEAASTALVSEGDGEQAS